MEHFESVGGHWSCPHSDVSIQFRRFTKASMALGSGLTNYHYDTAGGAHKLFEDAVAHPHADPAMQY
jgi:hypothetical protein